MTTELEKHAIRQSLFNMVARAIIAQGGGAYRPYEDEDWDGRKTKRVTCMYRGPNGTKCAFGHFIPDDAYAPGMEGRIASSVLKGLADGQWFRETSESVDKLLALVGPERFFFDALQDAHDQAALKEYRDGAIFMVEWKHRMRTIASLNSLNAAALDAIPDAWVDNAQSLA